MEKAGQMHLQCVGAGDFPVCGPVCRTPIRLASRQVGSEGVESVYTVSPVARSTSFNLILRGDACHRTSDDIKSIVISDKNGQLSFKAPQGLECNVTVSKV